MVVAGIDNDVTYPFNTEADEGERKKMMDVKVDSKRTRPDHDERRRD